VTHSCPGCGAPAAPKCDYCGRGEPAHHGDALVHQWILDGLAASNAAAAAEFRREAARPVRQQGIFSAITSALSALV
jgi:hypothetical protein